MCESSRCNYAANNLACTDACSCLKYNLIESDYEYSFDDESDTDDMIEELSDLEDD